MRHEVKVWGASGLAAKRPSRLPSWASRYAFFPGAIEAQCLQVFFNGFATLWPWKDVVNFLHQISYCCGRAPASNATKTVSL